MNWRVLFLLIALVLVWSGHVHDRPVNTPALASAAHPHGDWATALAQPSTDTPGDPSSAPLAAQVAEEAVVDLIGLLPPSACASVSMPSMDWPGLYASLARIAPYLDGPQRPPRVAHVLT